MKKVLLVLAFILAGCTTPVAPHYFTDAEDAEIRKNCEATGCAIVPAPLWYQLLTRLKDICT